jgi:membrane protein
MAVSEDRYNLQNTGTNYPGLGSLIRRTFSEWKRHEAPRLGAALAFYTIRSLAPLVMLALAVLALVFGNSDAQNNLVAQIQDLMGQQGAEAVKAMIEHAQKPSSGVLASAIGAITLLFGASGVAGELQAALNRMWGAQPESSGASGEPSKKDYSRSAWF